MSTRRSCSRRAYGLQFHIEVDSGLAAAWGEVPAYADSLRHTLGPDALPRLVAQVREHEREMIALARRLFARWLTSELGLSTPPATAQSHYAPL